MKIGHFWFSCNCPESFLFSQPQILDAPSRVGTSRSVGISFQRLSFLSGNQIFPTERVSVICSGMSKFCNRGKMNLSGLLSKIVRLSYNFHTRISNSRKICATETWLNPWTLLKIWNVVRHLMNLPDFWRIKRGIAFGTDQKIDPLDKEVFQKCVWPISDVVTPIHLIYQRCWVNWSPSCFSLSPCLFSSHEFQNYNFWSFFQFLVEVPHTP